MQSILQSNTISNFSASNLPTAVDAHFPCWLILLGISRLALGKVKYKGTTRPRMTRYIYICMSAWGGHKLCRTSLRSQRDWSTRLEQCQDSRTDNQPETRTKNEEQKSRLCIRQAGDLIEISVKFTWFQIATA